MELTDVRSALAVVAHPDDVESLCGGTIALLRAQGAQVAYLLLTSGDKGSPDPHAEPRAVAAIREAEQLAAARLLGVEDVTFLRIPDGAIADDLPTRAAIAAQVRRLRPDLILTFDPWHSYTFHNDHRQVALAGLAAARTLARRPCRQACWDGAPLPAPAPGHCVRAAWLFLTDRPNRVLDISPLIDLKIAARVAHACQTRDPDVTERMMRERGAAIGAPHGLALAEAFHEVHFPSDESLAARLDADQD